MTKQTSNTSMTKGQMKRVARKKEIAKAKRRVRLTKIVSVSLISAASLALVTYIGYSVYRNLTLIKPSSDYSAYLTDEGLIKDTAAADYLHLADYSSITVPLGEVEYADESVETDIQTLLEDYSTLVTETDALIEDGDKVNIDYVGSVDGVEFEGGNTEGAGADLEIGSDSYIDDFEDQLIGHGVGDEVTVEVTFPDDYSSEDLAGKEAVFEVVVNGIYEEPAFTDAFVQENLSDYASTADGYREYLKQSNYETNLAAWLENYLMENTTASSYPEKYTDHLKSIKKYEDQSSYEYINQLYSGSFSSFEDYVGMSESEYDEGLTETAQEQAKKSLIFQAIFEEEGLTADKDEYGTYFTDADYDSLVEQYGKGYVMQQLIYEKVMEYLNGIITVE